VASRVQGTVRIVGAGLLGSSVGHALRARGVDVVLADASPAQLRLAVDYGAGRLPADDDRPGLVVVAVPPDVIADVIQQELVDHPDAVVTDVASVKLEPLRELRRRGADLTRYIGSHPLAGRERGGAISARADIFVGRPWVVCRDGETSAADLAVVEALALDLGATPIEMSPEEHDRAVALVSHHDDADDPCAGVGPARHEDARRRHEHLQGDHVQEARSAGPQRPGVRLRAER
jgi:prephenate dehydrogenase